MMRREKRFYLSCPDCRQRLRRVCMEGKDVYALEIGYACPCSCEWTYSPNRNSIARGLPDPQTEEVSVCPIHQVNRYLSGLET